MAEGENTKFPAASCYLGLDNRRAIEKLESEVNGNLEKIWKALSTINKDMSSRVPVWNMLLMKFYIAVISVLLTALVMKIL